jgi:hypothetical protein
MAELDCGQAPLWGKLTAPEMVVHLGDQLRMALGEFSCEPVPGVWRTPVFRAAFLYIPGLWVKNQPGPPEAFVTTPTNWDADIAMLQELLNQLVEKDPASDWGDHPNLGTMSKNAWGIFTYGHFNHHLKQFAV